MNDLLAHYIRQRDDILATYGTGVRPAWVSGELAALNAKIKRLEAKP